LPNDFSSEFVTLSAKPVGPEVIFAEK